MGKGIDDAPCPALLGRAKVQGKGEEVWEQSWLIISRLQIAPSAHSVLWEYYDLPCAGRRRVLGSTGGPGRLSVWRWWGERGERGTTSV